MKKAIMILCVLTTLIGCGGGEMRQELRTVDSIVNQQPDSALAMLKSLQAEKAHWGKSDRMRYELLKAKAMNKADSLFTSDSIMKEVVAYYDAHGSANDQMEAHYLLGCAYRDMGEAPEALYTFNDAISCADTTSKTCNYTTLFRIYGQIAMIYQQQYLPQKEIKALEMYCHYAKRAGDTEACIGGKEAMVHPYFAISDTTKVLQVTDECFHAYKKEGMDEAAASVYGTKIHIDVLRGNYSEAKHLINIFENQSGLFDPEGNIQPDRIEYYYIKGVYYLGINRLDSAEISFRKLIPYGRYFYASKGLLSVYQKKQNLDSIVKYSQINESSLEKLIASNQSEASLQVDALYNYNSEHQKKLEKEEEARIAKIVILFLSIITILTVAFLYFRYRNLKKTKNAEIQRVMTDYLNALESKQQLKQELETIRDLNDERFKAMLDKKQSLLDEQAKKIEQYESELKHNDILEREKTLLNSDIVCKFHDMAIRKINQPMPSDKDWKSLEDAVDCYLPRLSRLLNDNPLSKQELKSCLLTGLGFQTIDIANLIGTSPTRISNAKKSTNMKLFNDSKADKLYLNLRRYYLLFNEM